MYHLTDASKKKDRYLDYVRFELDLYLVCVEKFHCLAL